MDDKTYTERLAHYAQQVERMAEMLEASTARERALKVQIDALTVQAEHLAQQIWISKYEKGVTK